MEYFWNMRTESRTNYVSQYPIQSVILGFNHGDIVLLDIVVEIFTGRQCIRIDI